jgi:hypothetical protein
VTLLGQHNINIAEWRLGRSTPRDRALSFVNLDAPVPQDVLVDLGRLEGMTGVRQVTL